MTAEFKETPCPACRVVFGLTKEADAVLRQSCQTFYCPFGHPMSFSLGESELEKMRRERDRLKQSVEMYRQGAVTERNMRQAAERRVSAARGQITRLKNRAANGVCPCCNRTFANLQRHMATKHAGYIAEVIDLERAS